MTFSPHSKFRVKTVRRPYEEASFCKMKERLISGQDITGAVIKASLMIMATGGGQFTFFLVSLVIGARMVELVGIERLYQKAVLMKRRISVIFFEGGMLTSA